MPEGKLRNPQIAEEAADWAVMLDAGELLADQKRRLADWLLESPRHVEELLIAVSLFDAFEGVDADKSRSIDELISNIPSEVVSIVRDHQQSITEEDATIAGEVIPRRQWLRWFAIGSAASIVFVLINVALVVQFTGQPDDQTQLADGSSGFTTQLGEQRKMTLEDGSIIHVNTQSEVAIRYKRDFRIVELLRGEALFEVAHDPNRPFRVIAGDTIAEAVGTTFNVYRAGDQTTVAVIDGKVAVETQDDYLQTPLDDETIADIGRTDDGRLLLAAGQKADVAPEAKTVRVASANIKAVSSWRVGQLIFEADNLGSIADQFNRYNRTRIVVDDELSATEFSGVFDADDPESLIAFLELSGDIRVDRSAREEIRLSSRATR